MDYSTLARAEAAAQQDDSASSHFGNDVGVGPLQRSRPLPSSSDAGHLALAAELAGEADVEGGSQGEGSVDSVNEGCRGSAFDEIAGTSGKAHITLNALPLSLGTAVVALPAGQFRQETPFFGILQENGRKTPVPLCLACLRCTEKIC